MRATDKYLKEENFIEYTGQKNLEELFIRLQRLEWNKDEEIS
jgi:hypothetical protein